MRSTFSVFIVGGFMLLLSPLAASEEQSIPESMMKFYPFAKLTKSPPNCKNTTWLETYEKASYVAMINVVGSQLLYNGTWLNIYKEEQRFRGSKSPDYLITAIKSLSKCDRYIIASNADGHISDCMGFAPVDGGIPSRAVRFTDINWRLLRDLFKWAKLI